MTQAPKVGRPATGQTPVRTVRLGGVWTDAKAAADARGESMATLVERALRAELGRLDRAARREGASDS